jgi:hypothetical protein
VQGEGAGKIDRVVHGKKQGDKIGYVVGMEVGEAKVIHPAKIKPEAGQLPQGAASAIKKNEVRFQG